MAIMIQSDGPTTARAASRMTMPGSAWMTLMTATEPVSNHFW